MRGVFAMTWKRVEMFIPACDSCGWECWTDIAAAPVFVTPRIGRAALAEEYEWRIERTVSGIEMRCGDCAAKQDCERLGHMWEPPTVDDQDPLATILPDRCRRCAVVRRTDRPEGDHPESMDVELNDEQESWLALVDETLFSEEAA